MHMIAFYKQEAEQWKHTSMLTYNIGKFGNSDPKHFPRTIQQYMPSLWKEEGEQGTKDRLIEAHRFFLVHKHINGLNGGRSDKN